MRQALLKGQAMVEAGLILFVFITFLVGTLDFGQYLYFIKR